MGILEIILNNWFILLIIYIAISTFMKAKRGGTERPDQPSRPARPVPGGMPPFGGDGPRWPKRPKERQESKAAGPAETRPEPAAVQAQRPERIQGPRSVLQTPVPALRKSSVRTQTPVTSSFRPTPEDLARGVLWAEILGPPRAKRPYRR
ncbi:Uncharacterised protein [Mycobacterium tuberculosis]|nr:Uncharacterised protein [Mycobacterium tuberculosis]